MRHEQCTEQHGSFYLRLWIRNKTQIHQNQPVGFSNAQSTAFPSALFWAGIVPSSSYPSTQETEVHGPGWIQGQSGPHSEFQSSQENSEIMSQENWFLKNHIFILRSSLFSFIIHLFPRPTFQNISAQASWYFLKKISKLKHHRSFARCEKVNLVHADNEYYLMLHLQVE